MSSLNIPYDSFSHGQVKSKLWLTKCLNNWLSKHNNSQTLQELTWYACWIGLGPFMYLSQSVLSFKQINLIDIDPSVKLAAEKILNYWMCEGLNLNVVIDDINKYLPSHNSKQLFINTSCEHLRENTWLKNIPEGNFVLLQSTDMKHIEHINNSQSLVDFTEQNLPYISILESAQLDFNYPDRTFSRYMIFGLKK